VLPKDKLTVTGRGILCKVPAILPPHEVITISIAMPDVLKVLAHFGKSMPLLFLYVSQEACARIRRQLKMQNNQAFFLEVQSPDETQKRITILPEKMTEENKAVLKSVFESKLQELESKDANEILVRSSPKDIALLKAKMGLGGPGGAGGNGKAQLVEQPVVKYCQYPPDSPGNVSICNEDYNCLEAEQFLNDVIIDFYLKYIQTEIIGTGVQKERTHIFTTYFYKKLTTRPNSKVGVECRAVGTSELYFIVLLHRRRRTRSRTTRV
jgi:sentrin-specific protease 7